MNKLMCPRCGSKDLEDDMISLYGIWGELMDTEQVKKCKKCGEIIRDGEKREDDPE